MTKRCTKCRKTKAISEFRRVRKGAHKRISRCRGCVAAPAVGSHEWTTHYRDERELRCEVVEFLVCSLAEFGEDQVVASCIRVLDEMNLREIGLVFGLCRERVRQIEDRALHKMRRRAEIMPELREAVG